MYSLCERWTMGLLGVPDRVFLGEEAPPPWSRDFTPGVAPWESRGGVQDPSQDWFVPGATSDWVKDPGGKQRWSEADPGGKQRWSEVDPMNASTAETIPSRSPQKEALPVQLVIPSEEGAETLVLTRRREGRRYQGAEEMAKKRRGGERLLPRVTAEARAQAEGAPPTLTPLPERTWPDLTREKFKRRICAENYSAVEIHGFYGLIDDGSDGAGRMLIVHVPKWVRGYFLDIKQGDTLHVYHPSGRVGGQLYVLATGRHRYYKPGSKVSTCTVCVPEDQWAPFARL